MATATSIPLAGKAQNLVRETGNMAAVGLEATRKVFSRPWPVAEFLDQLWFLAKVTTVPVILISIPFGMVISLQVGSLIRQLGAEAHLGSALVLAVVPLVVLPLFVPWWARYFDGEHVIVYRARQCRALVMAVVLYGVAVVG